MKYKLLIIAVALGVEATAFSKRSPRLAARVSPRAV